MPTARGLFSFSPGIPNTERELRKCPIPDFKYVVVGHNKVRGVAGASGLKAELVVRKGF